MKDRCVYTRSTVSYDKPTITWRCSRKAVAPIIYVDTILKKVGRVRVCRQHANIILTKGHIYAPTCRGAKEVKDENHRSNG